jgi:hypothetical protein
MRNILSVRRNVEPHWVGDGFPVRSLFSYHDDTAVIDPFLLLDYAGPARFEPSAQLRGVGEHPHRGFETVTIVFQGELEHRDSAGNQGKIGPGDVQWMTAASGVVHEEFHSREFSQRGGTFEVVQLWVNLPAKMKMSPPRYQGILDRQIPVAALSGDAGSVRVIAGEFQGVRGPAQTFSPVHLWDMRLRAGHVTEVALPEGHTAMLLVRNGSVAAGEREPAGGAELVIFERTGGGIALDCRQDAAALVLCGAPLGEPVVGQGPFVMNFVTLPTNPFRKPI